MLGRGISLNFDLSHTPAVIGFVALVIFGLSERLLHILKFRQPKSPEKETTSFYFCTLSWLGVVLFSLLDAVNLHWTTVTPSLLAVSYVGVPLVVVGIAVRIVARLTLGKQFSGHVQTTESHRLVTSGIYSLVQHPAYLSFLCLLVGLPVCFGSIGGLGCAVVLAIPALIYRIRVEERALQQWFGEEYRQYQERTSRLVPPFW